MRNQPPFECPRCGLRSPFGARCEGCRVDMLDQAGVPPLAHPIRFFDRASVGHVTATVALSMRAWFARRARGDVALTRIADAATRTCRIAGTVAVQRAVPAFDGRAVACHRMRRRHANRASITGRWGETRVVEVISYEDVRACGRFTVSDGSGTAVVDDDCFDLWPLDGDAHPDGVVVEDGFQVEIVGPASWAHAADVREVAARTGYRDAGRTLVFDGRPDARLQIFAAGPADLQSRSSVRPS